jgi:hypothetical protein
MSEQSYAVRMSKTGYADAVQLAAEADAALAEVARQRDELVEAVLKSKQPGKTQCECVDVDKAFAAIELAARIQSTTKGNDHE